MKYTFACLPDHVPLRVPDAVALLRLLTESALMAHQYVLDWIQDDGESDSHLRKSIDELGLATQLALLLADIRRPSDEKPGAAKIYIELKGEVLVIWGGGMDIHVPREFVQAQLLKWTETVADYQLKRMHAGMGIQPGAASAVMRVVESWSQLLDAEEEPEEQGKESEDLITLEGHTVKAMRWSPEPTDVETP